jgi:GNAT superfamily N-acetyltransferase
MTAARIAPAASDADIRASFPVMRELRQHFTDEAAYLAAVKRQSAEGYRLALRWHEGPGGADEVVACAGWRFAEMLAYGRFLYVDDLVTAERHRSEGHGEALIAWLEAAARAAGCGWLSLDSGTHRTAAHRFYFRQRLTIASFHFVKKLE